MNSYNAFKIFRWELEESLSFPVFEFLVASTIFLILYRPITVFSFSATWENLRLGMNFVFLFLVFCLAAVFSRSWAGSFSKGEIKLLLSYPIKRGELFIAKFLALFLVLSLTFGTVFSINAPLLMLKPSEIVFYLSLATLLLQILLVSSITTAISLITKNEIISILVSTLLFFGLEIIANDVNLLSANGRFGIILDYFTKQNTSYGLQDVGAAFAVPLVTSAVVLSLSFIYFTRFLEVD
jgi:ABC-type transport system involved in multi-copper enzyme maturation permease subunit